MPLVSVVCCQAQVSTTIRSLNQRSFTERDVPECDLESTKMRTPRPIRIVEPYRMSIIVCY
jgi:hypothetical protein